ncbi:haloacetate dehalogenase H-2 [Arthrobacter sp. Hiyo4]|nr:haloacetate dehalogenase H-2 [Arthrobacter sp. Hiyo4]
MLLVAVHPWDIHGAARAGMRTAWLNRSGGSYPEHFQDPDFTVTTLTGLPTALAAGD